MSCKVINCKINIGLIKWLSQIYEGRTFNPEHQTLFLFHVKVCCKKFWLVSLIKCWSYQTFPMFFKFCTAAKTIFKFYNITKDFAIYLDSEPQWRLMWRVVVNFFVTVTLIKWQSEIYKNTAFRPDHIKLF